MNHTPIPWVAKTPGAILVNGRLVTIGYPNIIYPDGIHAVDLAAIPKAERMANVLVMVAGPYLLAAAKAAIPELHELVTSYGLDDDNPNVVALAKLRDAVAKAEGRMV